jgi:hypothetical protein
MLLLILECFVVIIRYVGSKERSTPRKVRLWVTHIRRSQIRNIKYALVPAP